MPVQRPTVILVDDHPMMLAGLKALFEPSLDVVATASEGRSLLELAPRLQPDLVVTDISMPGLDGLEVTRRLATLCPDTKAVILSCHGEASWVRSAFEAGARAYILKTAAPEHILGALNEVLAGNFYVSPSLTRVLVAPPSSSSPGPDTMENQDGALLTPREQLISKLVAQGLHNKEIAHRLGVSVTTVRTHLSNLYTKLGGLSRIELVLQAARSSATLG
jgi:DNA-binding NarL/FixJ family response regulator